MIQQPLPVIRRDDEDRVVEKMAFREERVEIPDASVDARDLGVVGVDDVPQSWRVPEPPSSRTAC